MAVVTTAASAEELCSDKEREDHPVLCRMVERVSEEPERLAEELMDFSREAGLLVEPIASLGDDISAVTERYLRTEANSDDQVPVVLAHGMGDSCFNNGMQSLTKYASQLLGDVYGTCIPTGDSQHEDTINGYFKVGRQGDSISVMAVWRVLFTPNFIAFLTASSFLLVRV